MVSVERVYLIGFMGSGKSTIGRFIANDMGWVNIDMDHLFEKEHNCTISYFFENHGEQAFREEEEKILQKLSTEKNIIISTGGGTPCHNNNMEIMRSTGLTIYIQVDAEELKKRLSSARETRPLLVAKKEDELLLYIKTKLAEREPFYNQAHMIVDGMALPFYSYKMLIELFPAEELIRQ